MSNACRDGTNVSLFFALVPQWLAGLEHVLHASLGARVSAEAEEGFALEVEQVLFGDFGLG
jgi:hypothetical protein